ncbi:hypothetical protein MEO41_27300, partial [Dolichospermum sp. ST_sed4]|nr:hypothetical protein [Dolichospermum sp. ST_sed4]
MIIWVKVQNIGTKDWVMGEVQLAPSSPARRESAFMPTLENAPELANKQTNWIHVGVNTSTIQMDKQKVAVGETVGFGFYIKAPANKSAGIYREYFQPIVDGVSWMKDTGIHWDVKVEGSPVVVPNIPAPPVPTPNAKGVGVYDYEIVSQSSYPSRLYSGQVVNVSLDIKNTGTATWYKTGANPLRLGTGSVYGLANQQRDYASEFYVEQTKCGTAKCAGSPDGWLSPNRPVAIDKDQVKPGETARFQFNIKAPSTSGNYKAYFTPVVDGVGWLRDMG